MPIRTSQNISTGVKPHYLNKLIELDAEETPAFSLLPKGEPLRNPIAQQPIDDKETVSKRGVRDGAPATGGTSSDNYRLLKSWNHMLQTVVSAGKKAEHFVDQAGIGIKGQYMRDLEKKMRAQKVAADQVMCDDSDMRAEGADGSETRGLFSWCSNSAQSVEPVDELYRTPTGQISTVAVNAFYEETFQNLVNEHYDNTGKMGKFTVLAGIKIKQQVSNWSIFDDANGTDSYIRRFTGDVSKEKKMLNAVVSVLECDGGRVEMHLSRNLLWDRATNVRGTYSPYAMVGWNSGAAEMRFGWMPNHEELAKRGAMREGMIDMDFALCANPTGLIKYQPTALS